VLTTPLSALSALSPLSSLSSLETLRVLQGQRRQMDEQRRVVEALNTQLDMDLKSATHQLQLCPTREALDSARGEVTSCIKGPR
jgi:hypothetical protein